MESLPAGAGPLGLLSGGEFRPAARAFDEALLAAAPGRRIGLVLCADHRGAPRSAANARAHFQAFDPHVEVTALPHGEGFEDVDVLYIAGGSPVDLTGCTALRGRWPEIEARWRAGDLALAGSSAGAMALCTYCLMPTPGARMPTRWTAEGFGPLAHLALAVHASSRTQEWLELIACSAPAGVTLLALDDDAALILRPGAHPQTFGRTRSLPAPV